MKQIVTKRWNVELNRYESPKFFQEDLGSQSLRIENEQERARLEHAMMIGKQSLRYLDNRRLGGEVFTPLEAEVMMQTQCKMDGVAPEFRDAIVSLVVEKYMLRGSV